MLRTFGCALLLFILYEGFCFLPDNLVVIPGVFRISDAFFVFIPFIALIMFLIKFQAYRLYGEESRLVLAICLLMLINPLMSHIYFGQSYVTGLILIRQSFFWFSFFVYVLLLKDIVAVEKLINLLTLCCGIYVAALIVTKYFPQLGLIHFDKRYYDNSGIRMRFGEFRLFFPYGTVPIYFYCLTLARLLHAPKTEKYWAKIKWALFLCLVMYAVLSTYTRSLVSSILIVTMFAVFQSRYQMLKFMSLFFAVSFVLILVVGSLSEGEIPLIGDTKLAKMVTQQKELQDESGRKFQVQMFLNQLVRSPISGVGTLAPLKDTNWMMGVEAAIKKYGFVSAVDVGYPKVAGEYGVLGIAWVVWFFYYLYRSSKKILSRAVSLRNAPFAEAFARGHLCFFVSLLISGLTIPHFVHPHGLTIIAFSLAIVAVTRVSLDSEVVVSVADSRPIYQGTNGIWR